MSIPAIHSPVRRARGAFAASLAAALFFLAGSTCDRPPAVPDSVKGPAVVIRNQDGQDWTVTVELARTPLERQKGLMWRWSLPKDHGMLFIFDDLAVRSFWMKNTRIPLDMIFIGPDNRIVGIVENAEPYTETKRMVEKPSRWVLEVAGGECATRGVKAGDLVYFFRIGE